MDVKIVRVVVDTIGVADGVCRVESLREFSHHFPHGGLQYPVRDPARLYEVLTHHISVECGNIPVVTPGDPQKSALMKVLKGPCSDKVPQMPNGCRPEQGNCVPENYVAAIERWITLGAPKD